jgi:hypothetical protein
MEARELDPSRRIEGAIDQPPEWSPIGPKAIERFSGGGPGSA